MVGISEILRQKQRSAHCHKKIWVWHCQRPHFSSGTWPLLGLDKTESRLETSFHTALEKACHPASACSPRHPMISLLPLLPAPWQWPNQNPTEEPSQVLLHCLHSTSICVLKLPTWSSATPAMKAFLPAQKSSLLSQRSPLSSQQQGSSVADLTCKIDLKACSTSAVAAGGFHRETLPWPPAYSTKGRSGAAESRTTRMLKPRPEAGAKPIAALIKSWQRCFERAGSWQQRQLHAGLHFGQTLDGFRQ